MRYNSVMVAEKIERNKQIYDFYLKHYGKRRKGEIAVLQTWTISAIARKFGIGTEVAWRIIQRWKVKNEGKDVS